MFKDSSSNSTTVTLSDAPDDLAELDSLLEESLAAATKHKALRRQTGNFGAEMTPIDYFQAAHWVTQFNCAFFIEQHCACGSVRKSFSHFAAWQIFSKKMAGKPSCWKKLEERPVELKTPRTIKQAVPLCCECYNASEAVDFGETPEEF